MMYSTYDWMTRTIAPFQVGANWWFQAAWSASEQGERALLREIAAEFELIALSRVTHTRPSFNIERITDSDGKTFAVEETVVLATDFAKLIRFKREGALNDPKVLLVSPMSGHFSTLLAGTLRTLVRDHEVYMTDWINPRHIPLQAGQFGFSEYVEHLVKFQQTIGPGTHLMGVCQPTVACMAASAVMAQDNDPCQPASLILMAGPIDTRQNPTKVNELAKEKPIEWFKQNLVSTVPFPHLGTGRKVYPGFVQLSAFVSMNKDRHIQAFKQLKQHRSAGEYEKADAIANFYREYFAVMDLQAEFYIETVQRVFQDHDLPMGKLMVGERRVDCTAIRKPFLLTIE